jgi:hypothetical protein
MHPMRTALASVPADPAEAEQDRLAWARDFVVGWLAGLIFFGTMLS